jgi:hypothetical protein
MTKIIASALLSLFIGTIPVYGISWQLTPTMTATLENGTLAINGTGTMPNYELPGTSNQNKWAPWLLSSFTNVEIHQGVTSIGNFAFYGSLVSSVSIPQSVANTGHGAFALCTNLKSVTIPSGVVGSQSFLRSGLSSVTLGNGVTSINYSAFQECENITAISIPVGVKIDSEAFLDCSKLSSVTISAGVVIIGSKVFEGTAWYDNQPDGTVYLNHILYNYKGEMPENTSVNIKAGTTVIAPDAFYRCSGLTAIDLPGSLVYIGDYAFYSCSKLASVKIPDNVTNIGASAFAFCHNISTVTLGNEIENIGKAAFQECSQLKSIIIPDRITVIHDQTFSGCSELSSVVLPEKLASIGEESFMYCSLASITIPNTVTEIGSKAFQYCKSLSSANIPTKLTILRNNVFTLTALVSVIIPSGVKEIQDSFTSCSALVSVTIPASVETIGYNTFQGCNKLISVTNLRPIPQTLSYGSLTFLNVDFDKATLHVPAGSKAAYESATIWRNFTNILEDATTDIPAIDNTHFVVSCLGNSLTITGLRPCKTLHIYNVSGQLLFSLKSSAETETISVAHLPAGVYFVRTESGQTEKWMKK